ncbi:FimB/Mfa2 family fimbrial subunit [Bacteroides ovatus]|uniref:FimB/Mfa2 family fimbrial subunit n=1 Tax=Bacteroides ovatus TaxID=28116 RepID=UPI002030862D|nr:FimB/Mfa2 family fimbrial subunit [Bacteroides ovatus]MCM1719481.1 DUF5119 domain-containing protein [Bacteroides ovatus]MCM1754696.1 DUF5119 domain-containing protein [Bacteroides ovatus]MCM1865070.1 DUF5119 domain-containing protein [Bacteroides ovatus]MCM1909502.1 DUF5119 domain-containing protein [Bacteroides ovatus]
MKRVIKLQLVGAVAIATLLAACDVKDPIYNTPHPEHGKITLTTEWDGIGEGLTAPAAYTVATLPAATSAATGGYTATLKGATNTLDHLFDPGAYRILVYNTPEHITVSSTTASVEAATPPAGLSGTFIHNAPDWLFASATDAVIEADKEHSYTAVMQQQVRELTLIIEPTGETTDRIESITGTLSGIASSLNFADGTHAAPANVAMTFSKITSGTDAGKWSATVRLLGTAGAEQRLAATIVFTNDNPATVNLDSDLTMALAAFNTNKRTPLTLGGSVVETPTGAGFGATIDDWTTVDGGDIDANM